MKKFLFLAGGLSCLTGCIGPMTYREALLPDGGEIRVYGAASLVNPSLRIVAFKPSGLTNWTLPNIFSGPGLIPGASTGGGIAAAGSLIRPSHSSSEANSTGGNSSSSTSSKASSDSNSSSTSQSSSELNSSSKNHNKHR